MASGKWIYRAGKHVLGPVSTEQIKSLISNNKLLPTDLIKQEGEEGWIKAGSLLAFSPKKNSNTNNMQTQRKIPKWLWNLIIILAIAIVFKEFFSYNNRNKVKENEKLVDKDISSYNYNKIKENEMLANKEMSDVITKTTNGIKNKQIPEKINSDVKSAGELGEVIKFTDNFGSELLKLYIQTNKEINNVKMGSLLDAKRLYSDKMNNSFKDSYDMIQKMEKILNKFMLDLNQIINNTLKEVDKSSLNKENKDMVKQEYIKGMDNKKVKIVSMFQMLGEMCKQYKLIIDYLAKTDWIVQSNKISFINDNDVIEYNNKLQVLKKLLTDINKIAEKDKKEATENIDKIQKGLQ